MKNTLLLILFLIAINSQSQTKIIKANPLGLAFNIANIGYEFANKNNQSSTFSALYYSASDLEGFGIGIEKRFYFQTKESLKGFHAGPNFGYLNLNNKNDIHTDVFSAGVDFGYQWFLGKHFALDLFSNANFLTGSFYFKETILLGVGFSIGFAW